MRVLALSLSLSLAGALAAQRLTQRQAAALVVLSSDRKPYRAAAGPLVEQLLRAGRRPRTIVLADLKKLAQPFRAPAPKLIYAIGSTAAAWLARHRPTGSVLLYCMVTHPERYGLLGSRFIHGVAAVPPLATQFDQIRNALPGGKTIGLLYNPRTSKGRSVLAEVKSAVPKNWRLRAIDVSRCRSMGAAIDALLAAPPTIVWTAPDASIYSAASLRALLLKCVRKRVPVYGFSSSLVRAGALLGFAVDPREQGQQCATLTAGALKTSRLPAGTSGSAPGLHQPPKHVTQLNLLVARRLGLHLPAKFVRRCTVLVKAE